MFIIFKYIFEDGYIFFVDDYIVFFKGFVKYGVIFLINIGGFGNVG